MMRTAQRKLMALGLASVGVVALIGWGTYAALAQPPATSATGPEVTQTPPNPKPRPTGDTADPGPPGPAPLQVPKELRERLREAARQVYEQNMKRIKNGEGLPTELFGWSERWLEAELALADKPADRAKALRAHLDRTRDVEGTAALLARAGQGRQADAEAATYYRLQAEARLLKEGVEPLPAKDENGKPEKK
jgi:hypothetical protein